MRNNVVVLITKDPVNEPVKQYLVEKFRDEAQEYYKKMVDFTLQENQSRDYSFVVASRVTKYFDNLGFETMELPSENLGFNLSHVFQETSKRFDKIVLENPISEIISSKKICQYFDFLENTDVLLGPTSNGKLYLIGMKKYNDIFLDSYKENDVFDRTKERIIGLGLEHKVLK